MGMILRISSLSTDSSLGLSLEHGKTWFRTMCKSTKQHKSSFYWKLSASQPGSRPTFLSSSATLIISSPNSPFAHPNQALVQECSFQESTLSCITARELAPSTHNVEVGREKLTSSSCSRIKNHRNLPHHLILDLFHLRFR